MIVEDFIMLGTTVPEPKSDGRVFVCSAGYSPELRQLIRIYPLARYGAPKRWSVNRVRLERNSKDSRRESWSIAGDRSPETHTNINQAFEKVGEIRKETRADFLRGVTLDSKKEADRRRLSLTVIEPSTLSLTFEHNPESPDSPELRLFPVEGAEPVGAKRFPFIPRIEFDDDEGSHKLQLRDWGTYEFLRKQGDERRHQLADALSLSPSSSLLIGNMSHQRNAWLVISVLNGIRRVQTPLFEMKETA